MANDIEIIQDNTDEAAAAIGAAIARGLEAIGLQAEGYAAQKCPVDTGRLRNSITHMRINNDAYIGTNVEYGKYVELGTSRQKAQPFLRPAAEGHASEYRAILEAMLRNG